MDERRREGVQWADAPDSGRTVMYHIYAPKPGRDVNLVILGETLHGAYTHWIDKRTRPCMGTKENCEGCQLGIDKRWKGYLACWDRGKGRLVLAEVTREAYLRCPQFEVWKGQLRGKTLKLQRNGESRNSRVTATVAHYGGPPGSLPPAFNVVTALEHIWFDGPDGAGPVTVAPSAPPGPDRPGMIQPEFFQGGS